MKELFLKRHAKFDGASQEIVSLFFAQLEDQTRRLKEKLAGLEPAELEFQPQPGMNSVGMLLAHIAIVEVYWISAAPKGMVFRDAGERVLQVLAIGLDDDGMPVPPEGRHPETLRGWSLDRYVDLLDRARAESLRELANWQDASLQQTYTSGERIVSREWTLYHVLEHQAQHQGQIGLLLHYIHDRRKAAALPAIS